MKILIGAFSWFLVNSITHRRHFGKHNNFYSFINPEKKEINS